MSFPDSNHTAIYFTECSGYNGVSILEPLFDKLIKKALTYVNKNMENHNMINKQVWSEGAVFQSIHPVGNKKQSMKKNSILCLF